MAKGRVVFDGAPEALTMEVIERIYGVDGLREAFDERITSTAIEPRTGDRELVPA
jgi:phosphonate transport system ATP-binding protein